MKIYDSIKTLPIFNYMEITKTGNMQLLVLEGIYPDEKLSEIWKDIQKQIINEFGFSNDILQLRRLYKSLKLTELNHFITQDDFIINDINHITDEINKKIALMSESTVNYYQQKAMLHSHFKFVINDRKMTVIDYFYLLEQYSKEIKNDGRQQNI